MPIDLFWFVAMCWLAGIIGVTYLGIVKKDK